MKNYPYAVIWAFILSLNFLLPNNAHADGNCVSGNCLHGFGTKRYDDGRVYEGHWSNGMANGQGTLKYENGSWYEGEWHNDRRSGYGELKWFDGTSYKGQWQNDKWHGQGAVIYSDGTSYVGNLKDGIKDGEGSAVWPDGSKYEGTWKSGTRDGSGTYTGATGLIYKGEWQNDKWHGRGSVTYANGATYVGDFKFGYIDGQVQRVWQDGSASKAQNIFTTNVTDVPRIVSGVHGQPKVVLVFSSRCSLSRNFWPQFLEFANQYWYKNISFVVFSMDTYWSEVVDFLSRYDLPFNCYWVAAHGPGTLGPQIRTLGVNIGDTFSMPLVVAHDSTGRVVGQWQGLQHISPVKNALRLK